MELILSQYDRFHTSKMPLLNSSSCSRKQCLCLMRAHYLDTATAVTAKEEKKKSICTFSAGTYKSKEKYFKVLPLLVS